MSCCNSDRGSFISGNYVMPGVRVVGYEGTEILK